MKILPRNSSGRQIKMCFFIGKNLVALYKPKVSLWSWRIQNGTHLKSPRPRLLRPLWPALHWGLPQQCECTWVQVPPVWAHILGFLQVNRLQLQMMWNKWRFYVTLSEVSVNAILQNHFVFLILLGISFMIKSLPSH